MFFVSKNKYEKLQDENWKVCFEKNALKSDIKMLESTIQSYEHFLKSIETFSLLDNRILGFERNNLDELMCVVANNDTGRVNRTLYLYSVSKSKTQRQTPRCYFDCYAKSRIKIVDIFSEEHYERRSGNGSIMLKYLEKIAVEEEVKEIGGELSCVDHENFDQLEHFYKKNGFNVYFKAERRSGHIKKMIM